MSIAAIRRANPSVSLVLTAIICWLAVGATGQWNGVLMLLSLNSFSGIGPVFDAVGVPMSWTIALVSAMPQMALFAAPWSIVMHWTNGIGDSIRALCLVLVTILYLGTWALVNVAVAWALVGTDTCWT
jgi:hypothetical protein